MAQRKSLAWDFASGLAFYAIPVLVRAAASFLTIPIYTRYLTPADYGILELLDLTSFLFAVLIGTNFGHSVFYYYSAAETPADRGRTISTAYMGSLLLAGIAVLMAIFGAPPLSSFVFGSQQYTSYFRLVFTTLAFTFPAEVGLSCVRAMDRPRAYSLISSARLLVAIALNIILLTAFHMHFEAMLWSSLTVTALTAAYMGWFCLPWLKYLFSASLFWKQLNYSWPLNVSGLAMLIIDLGDRYFLKRSVTLAELGIYGFAYKLGMIVAMISLIFNQFWKPKMFHLIRQPHGDKIYVRVYTYYTLVLTYVCLGLTVILRPLLQVAAGPKFLEAAAYLPWIALAYVIRCAGDYFRNAFYLSKTTANDAKITWLGSALCVAGYVGFIPWLRLWGAILATGLAFLVMFGTSYLLAQRVRPFQFETRRLLWVAVSGVLLIGGYLVFEPAGMVWQLALGATLMTGFPLLLLRTGFFDQNELAVARKLPLLVKTWLGVKVQPEALVVTPGGSDI
jgi:O-antigen/teichoic acid export membrane protein